ncbi:unnamed protein product [Cylicostephanus goldi]|uniref:Uncharacterized protein n=1 Tax=Cylicostephanus goldi TaxID=71465 RepID=A0A3P6RDX9_CYLGO|nr:unnamed protein product [Cylicostephanus goldi]
MQAGKPWQPATQVILPWQRVESLPVAEPGQLAGQDAQFEQPAEPAPESMQLPAPSYVTVSVDPGAQVFVIGPGNSIVVVRAAQTKQLAKPQIPMPTDQEQARATFAENVWTDNTNDLHGSPEYSVTLTPDSVASTPRQPDLERKFADFCKDLGITSASIHYKPKRLFKRSLDSQKAPDAAPVLQGWTKVGGKVYYYRDGKKLVGWHFLRGTIVDPSLPHKNWFYFDKDGVMLTGRHEPVGGIKNEQGLQDKHVFFWMNIRK